MSFKNKTVFITGASRGIGKAIAMKLASHGANIVIAAKSTQENPKLGGTIFSAAKDIEAVGGKALAVQTDIRNEDQIANAVLQTINTFGGIDIVINNASAIQLTNTAQTPSRRFDLMHTVNVRGSFLVVQHCLPYLKNGKNPHILTLSPPINMINKWLSPHIAYTMSKFNMSMMALAWAGEFKEFGIASNSLWPQTTIDTAAVRNLLGGETLANMSRTPEIIADAAYFILSKENLQYTGNNFIDEQILTNEGITDFDKYAVVPNAKLFTDLFL
jgi:citronellol/citronellal dehydrogenase